MAYRIAHIAYRKKAFTLIELVITITVMGILLIPLGIMSMQFTKDLVYSRDLGVAENLAKAEMAKVNNTLFADLADKTVNNYEGYPYDMQRTVTIVADTSNNLKQVQVRIFPGGSTTNSLVNLITYVGNDLAFGSGSGGGGPGSGTDAELLIVSTGSISGKALQNITLANDGGATITVTGIIISFTGTSGIQLSKIEMGGSTVWNHSASSPSTVTLDSNFTLSAGTTYSNTATFTFSKNVTAVTSLVFVMSDDSQTGSYSW